MLVFTINFVWYCISDPKDISCSCTPSSVSERFFYFDFCLLIHVYYDSSGNQIIRMALLCQAVITDPMLEGMIVLLCFTGKPVAYFLSKQCESRGE